MTNTMTAKFPCVWLMLKSLSNKYNTNEKYNFYKECV